MSRLDWFTILIVGVCVVALGFLVYKTIQLMGNDQPKIPRSEISDANSRNEHQTAYEKTGEGQTDNTAAPGADDQDLDDDELPYDPKEVEAPVKEEPAVKTPPSTATEPASKKIDSGASSSQPKSQPVAGANTTPKTGAPSAYNSTGNFMVVAGSFSQRYNAESQVKRLKSLGYNNARVEIFNGGALATALVDRFDDYNRAKQLVDELKGKGVDCFVKRKQ